jgi:S1-C subfamily serine protease
LGQTDLPDRLMWEGRVSTYAGGKGSRTLEKRLMTTLQDISNALATAVEGAATGVVEVRARRGKSATGLAWDAEHVLTSSHSIQREDEITVTFGDKTVSATVVGRDGGSDLALLKAAGHGATPAPRGTAAGLRPGELVLALGRPGELQATFGAVVSTKSRQRGWRGAGGIEGLVRSDAHLYQGFSGGPLIDASGTVVAVNSWYYGGGETKSLPIEAAARVAESLLTHGRVKQPYLGIGTQPIYLSEDVREKTGHSSGLMVISIEAGSPAAAAGVVQGDTLVGIGDAPVGGMRDLFRALQGLEVGSKQKLQVIRSGKLQELEVTVGERQEDAA